MNNKLRALAEDADACPFCSRNAAWQLAVFLKLGFGICSDESENSRRLPFNGRPQADLDAILQEIMDQAWATVYWNTLIS